MTKTNNNNVHYKKKFQKKISKWYKSHGRDFFWRKIKLNLWEWVLLETCLKRTKAETVDKYVSYIITQYSTPQDILSATPKKIEKELSILGLQKQRTIALKKMANYIIKESDGKIPTNFNDLIKIPYIGQYSANAILCFGLGKNTIVLDINTSRVICRFFNYALPKDLRNKEFVRFVNTLRPNSRIKDFNYGLLDIGATICKKEPHCEECPLTKTCRYSRTQN